MSLAKSYRLLNFLNRERAGGLRLLLACLAWIGALFCCGNMRLAGYLAYDFRHNSLKLAFRRAGWLARTGWLNLSLVDDPYFIFSEGMTLDQVDHYIGYLATRKKKLNKVEYYTNYLMLLGQKIHQLIEQNEKIKYNKESEHPADKLIEEFLSIKQDLLEYDLPDPLLNLKYKANIRDGDFSKQDALAALQDIAQLLPLSEFPWYVISGTFLGMYRDGGFMEHDYDIDLGINYEEVDLLKLEKILKEQTVFVVKKTDYSLEVLQDNESLQLEQKPALIKLIHQTGINIDVFIHHLEGSNRWHGSSIHRWDNTDFDLTLDELEGVKVLRPTNPDLYLSENYGDWQTPVTDFNSSTGTPNLTITHNFLSHALFLKRMLLHQQSSNNYNKSIKAQLIINNPIKVNK